MDGEFVCVCVLVCVLVCVCISVCMSVCVQVCLPRPLMCICLCLLVRSPSASVLILQQHISQLLPEEQPEESE